MSYTINTGSLFGQPLISYSGLASGLNTGAIVNAQTAAASQNQSLLTASAALEAAKAGLYANVGNVLDALNTNVMGLQSAGLFAPSSSSSSNSASVAITNTSTTAQTGSYQVNVTQLAQGQINKSANFASATSTILTTTGFPPPSSGSVKIAVGGGATTTFAVNSSTTLTGLAQSINSSNIGATATVVNDANGYHINLASTGTGTSSALTITETNVKTAFTSGLVQAAKDAMGSVNGVNFDIQSNTSSTLIAGVTMSFAQLSGAPVTVNVYKDVSSLGSTVQAFVINYNAVVAAMNNATTYGSQTNLGNLLSDSSLQNVSKDLAKVIQSAPSSATGTYHTLAEIGITQNNDGTLSIDTNALTQAISTDASSVANLLSDTSTGTGIASQVNALTSTYGGPAGALMQMSLAQNGIGTADTTTATNMQYRIDAQAATMQSNFVRYEVNMSALATQNQLVEAFVNSLDAGNAAQNNTPVTEAASDASGPSNTAASLTTPAATPTADSSDGAETSGGGQNGYVPSLTNTTV